MRAAFVLSALFALVVLPIVGQNEINKKYTVRAYVGIPRIVGSQQFRTAFSGQAETGLSGNLRISGNVYAGLGYQYSQFAINKKEWAAEVIARSGAIYNKTALQQHAVFLKIGNDKFFSKSGYFSYSLNLGFANGAFKFPLQPDTADAKDPGSILRQFNEANPSQTALNYAAPYLQPEIAFNFMSDKAVSFNVLLSYTYMFTQFDARMPRFNHIGVIRAASNRSMMNWVNIGLGANILLGK